MSLLQSRPFKPWNPNLIETSIPIRKIPTLKLSHKVILKVSEIPLFHLSKKVVFLPSLFSQAVVPSYVLHYLGRVLCLRNLHSVSSIRKLTS